VAKSLELTLAPKRLEKTDPAKMTFAKAAAKATFFKDYF
jgi:hypothetical protein